jgi:LmbE family N-acetylglucosaminyl deacetylase
VNAPAHASPTKTQPGASPHAVSFADATRQLPLLDPVELMRDRGLIVIAPHPNDESLGCGGLLAWAADHAVPTRVVFLTDGERSGPQTGGDVGVVRREEAVRACGTLGISVHKIRFLGLPDTDLEALAPRDRNRATQSLRQLIAPRGRCLVAVTAETDSHGDHRAAYALARDAVVSLPGTELMAYPVWSWLASEVSVPLKGVRIPIRDQLKNKRQALATYASQPAHLPLEINGFTLPPELLRHVDADTEVLLWA